MKENNRIKIEKSNWMTDEQYKMITRCVRKIEDMRDQIFLEAETYGVNIDKWHGNLMVAVSDFPKYFLRIFNNEILVSFKGHISDGKEIENSQKLESYIKYGEDYYGSNGHEFYRRFINDCLIICETLDKKHDYYVERIKDCYFEDMKRESYFLEEDVKPSVNADTIVHISETLCEKFTFMEYEDKCRINAAITNLLETAIEDNTDETLILRVFDTIIEKYLNTNKLVYSDEFESMKKLALRLCEICLSE